MTINQGIAKVVFHGGKSYWVRITRRKISSLVEYWSKQHNFYYMKIYEFNGSGLPKFSPGRTVGKQIGFIYLNQVTQDYEFRSS